MQQLFFTLYSEKRKHIHPKKVNELPLSKCVYSKVMRNYMLRIKEISKDPYITRYSTFVLVIIHNRLWNYFTLYKWIKHGLPVLYPLYLIIFSCPFSGDIQGRQLESWLLELSSKWKSNVSRHRRGWMAVSWYWSGYAFALYIRWRQLCGNILFVYPSIILNNSTYFVQKRLMFFDNCLFTKFHENLNHVWCAYRVKHSSNKDTSVRHSLFMKRVMLMQLKVCPDIIKKQFGIYDWGIVKVSEHT